MMSEYLEPEKSQDEKQAEKNNQENTNAGKTGNAVTKGNRQRKHFKVLHKDGSFADLPYNNEPSGGALEGTVGIGT